MKRFLAVLAAVGMVACGGDEASNATGSIELSLSGPQSPIAAALQNAVVYGETDAASKIKSVWVSFESDDVGYYGDFEKIQEIDGGSFPVTFKRTGLFAGTYTVSAYACSKGGSLCNFASDLLFKASATVVVSDRKVSLVNLIMQQVPVPGTVEIKAPMITGIAITGTYPPVIGKPVQLDATVTNSPNPQFTWTVACATDPAPYLPFSAPNAPATSLTLYRCESDAVVTFSVKDETIAGVSGSLTSTVSFVLPYVPQGIEIPSITINPWPNILSIDLVGNAEPVPGESVQLVAMVNDPDGDPLAYQWTDNCGGSWQNANTLTPTFTAPNTPGEVCKLRLKVFENGLVIFGVNYATFELMVAPVILP